MPDPRVGEPETSRPRPAVAVQKCYDLVLWLMRHIERCPRSQRFTEGDRLAGAALDVLEAPVAAAYSRDKADVLERANLGLQRAQDLTVHPESRK